ncbi:FAD-dependent oxidoreductase, partial [Chloroflexota bacterium]
HTREIAAMANNIVDAIHVSTQGYNRSPLAHMPDTPGALLPLTKAIKEVVTVPVIAVGRLTPEVAEQAVEDGKADIVAFARELIADAELPNKVASGRLEDIRPCIACFYCQDSRALTHGPLVCAVNAAVVRERENEIKPAREVKKIAIIGGGPAGMEVARVLALRGHKVVLYEKESRLGGQINLAIVPSHKKDLLEPLITYLETQLNKLNVEIKLNTEANLELMDSLRPDVVILAAGVVPIVPQLTGINLDNVVTANDILAGRAEPGHKIVIVGGGSVGCETAEFLLEKGKEVTVVEMLPQLANDMGFRDKVRLMTRINNLPMTSLTNAKCSQIQKDGITVIDKEDKEQLISADTVVLAVGAKRDNSLFPLLRDNGFETHLVGDCSQVGRIAGAITDGFRVGCTLY